MSATFAAFWRTYQPLQTSSSDADIDVDVDADADTLDRAYLLEQNNHDRDAPEPQFKLKPEGIRSIYLKYLRLPTRFIPLHWDNQKESIHARKILLLWVCSGILFICILFFYYFARDGSAAAARAAESELWRSRASEVREAYRSSYSVYKQYASPHDELLPVSNGSQDKYVETRFFS